MQRPDSIRQIDPMTARSDGPHRTCAFRSGGIDRVYRTPLMALVLLLLVTTGSADDARQARREAIIGCMATYDGEPRTADRRVDIPLLLEQLEQYHANTYDFLIWHRDTDWTDLKEFLRATRGSDLKVWVSLVPPSESRETMSEPFGLDYIKWGERIGRLSSIYPNLVAWSIDDFTHNLSFYTPEYLGRMLDAAHAANPNLAFVPCTYFSKVSPQFAADYGTLLDALLFYYRHESDGANLTDATLCDEEIARVRQTMGPDIPVILGFYATGHSRLGSSSPEYVEQVMTLAHEHADGIHVYTHVHPESEKGRVIRRLFEQWSPQR